MTGPRIAIVAGEASGDRLGAGLIRAVQARRPDARFVGIAGSAMRESGCEAWFDAADLAVMGIFEVLRDLPRLVRIKRTLERRLLDEPPDVFVGIDAPDFNLRVERRLRANGIRTVHYVSPSVWAWRRGRVRVLRNACDRVLCLLPFESAFLEQHGVPAEFVGHPLADEIPQPLSAAAARERLGLDAGRVVALLPGSRQGELARLGPLFAQAAARLARASTGIVFAAPMASPALEKMFREQFRAHAPGVDARFFAGRVHDVVAASDVVLLTSGTASLETMLLGRPMVVAYRMSALTYDLLWLTSLPATQWFSLPNLLARRELVPELLQHAATPVAVADALAGLLDSPGRRETMCSEFEALGNQLRRSASERAARAVLQVAGSA